MLWHHFLSHPCPLTSPQLSPHYTSNQMATSHFSLKTMSQTKTSNFLPIFSSWCSNTCRIYEQVILQGWFWTHLGLFSPWRFNEWIPLIVPTLFSYYIGPHSAPIAHVLRAAYLLTIKIYSSGSLSHRSGGKTLYRLTSRTLCFQFHETFATHFPHTNLGLQLNVVLKQ
jgi:hypothetical protein